MQALVNMGTLLLYALGDTVTLAKAQGWEGKWLATFMSEVSGNKKTIYT